MDESRLSYDAATEELEYDSGLTGKTLLPAAIGKDLSRIGRAGTWNGNTVSRVVVRFADDVAAKHNVDPMAFLKLVSRGPGGTVESDARFVVRDDFGVKSS